MNSKKIVLTENQITLLKNLASELKVDYDWLYKLIKFESGFNPLIVNKITGAIGLIQFHPNYGLKDVGLTVNDIVTKYTTFESQLPLVKKYLSRYSPFPTKQSLYMAVFYPKYRFVPSDTLFSEREQKANKPIKKVQDYIDLVDGVFKNSLTKVLPLLTLIFMGYILFKK